jgi:integrase
MDDDAQMDPAAPLAPALGGLAAQARDYVQAGVAENTRRAYRAAWADFCGWCQRYDRTPLPAAPETVALYLTDLSGRRRVATLQQRLNAIGKAHRAAGFDPPGRDGVVRVVWSGIRRQKGTAQHGKAPLVTADLRRLLACLGPGPATARDRALLLLGYAGALRRSELVALDVQDVVWAREGLRITVRRSKTDQEGAGETVGIPYGSHLETCPVRALGAWLEAAGIAAGALFRPVDRHGNIGSARLGDRSVALVVQRACARAGLDPAAYAGHSLRAGLATAAAAAGVPERVIMAQTRHRSVTTLRRYIREGSLFRENAAAEVGL